MYQLIFDYIYVDSGYSETGLTEEYETYEEASEAIDRMTQNDSYQNFRIEYTDFIQIN